MRFQGVGQMLEGQCSKEGVEVSQVMFEGVGQRLAR